MVENKKGTFRTPALLGDGKEIEIGFEGEDLKVALSSNGTLPVREEVVIFTETGSLPEPIKIFINKDYTLISNLIYALVEHELKIPVAKEQAGIRSSLIRELREIIEPGS